MQAEVNRNRYWLRDLLKACWNVINFSRKLVLNLVFILIAIFIFAAIGMSNQQPIVVQDNSILNLKLVGTIVEEKTFVDPYDEFVSDVMGQSDNNPEVLLTDILDAINKATYDDNIQAIYLNVQSLYGGGMNKLQEVGQALTQFKQESGKPVLAYGDYYSQAQYYLAAHADQVWMHPMGAIGIDGFGRYRTYMKSALEKLKVNAHIFRVGTYKSAVEPFIRDDMSEAAKEANQLWLGDLWNMYKEDIAAARDMDPNNFDENIEQFLQKFSAVKGDFGQFATNNGWVDKLASHQELEHYLDHSWLTVEKPNWISLNNYLASELPTLGSNNEVGIVVARGTIYNGKRQAGEIGGKSTAALLKQARQDKSVKAIVLRVDSPGGSAFASEVIRNEVQAIKESGKPIVVSMSSMAASGGYWISASADEIWASPSTITGSIGIFGMIMTFEDTLSALGIHTDGVGTTDMAGISATRTLSEGTSQMIQTAINNGYQKFISLVADERDMSVDQVDKIAQGRVWSGKQAHDLGLVDNLGNFKDAIASAAALAGLENYGTKVIKKQLTPMEQFLADMFATLDLPATTAEQTQLSKLVNMVTKELIGWTELNDPTGSYLYCLECAPLN